MKGNRFHFIRRYLISGLLVWLPIMATIFVLAFIIGILDKSMALIPHEYQPAQLLGYDLPGVGVVLSILILFFTGMIASNFFGRRLVDFWDAIMGRIPIVRSIHAGVKQVLETLFSPGGKSFRKAVLVEYPRKGLYSIAFLTGDGNSEVNNRLNEKKLTIFIPTTPNPTSGFLMMIPEKDVVELDMSVEVALKFVISLGVMNPAHNHLPKVEN